jgi:hypothetical protein
MASESKKDPIMVIGIETRGPDRKIVNFVTNDNKFSYEDVSKEIRSGQDYIILDENNDPSELSVDQNGTIRTVKDGSELNNLRGNTNIIETVID